jgi:hypothetical protein
VTKNDGLRFLGLDEVVALLHSVGLTDLKRRWVQDQIDRRKLGCVVIARRRRVKEANVQRLIEAWDRAAR